ncbi:universal stress protein [Emticicia sp. SJ17W-69]|uniref:universal stress protein n=1 Tax=Emticicia sp. SJ17W-69 TaxID=3421657 RepID=UPI003EBD2382
MIGRIKNILFPTDFSDIANNAMRFAVAIAKRQQAKLHIFHAVIPEYLPVVGDVSLGVVYDGYEEVEKMNSKKLKNLAISLAATNHLKVESHTKIGNVAESIDQLAKELQIDLIVMGTHGTSNMREFFIGSNAYSTVKNSHCPVLTIPANSTSTDFSTVLFPVRNVKGVDEKYLSIINILKANRSKVLLLGVAHFNDFDSFDFISDKVNQLSLKMHEDGIEVKNRNQYCENIANFILDYTYATKPDLLVINANIDTDWKRYFLGSFAQRIVNNAPCPVLNIKPQ